jgi:alkanesulfonate monooxygenase
MSLKFHWMLAERRRGRVGRTTNAARSGALSHRVDAEHVAGAVRPDLAGWTHFARHAEAAGIDSVLISFSRYEPDPFVVACALGQAVKKLKFIIAYRSGLMQPTTFVQQMNTVSALV